MAIVSLIQLTELAERALVAAGAGAAMAAATAKALVGADAQGLTSHGVARVAKAAGIDVRKLKTVVFKSGTESMLALLGGHIDLSANAPEQTLKHIESGKLRALAIATTQRSRLLPEVPTMEEAGLKGYVSTVWNGIFVKTGTPAPMVERLSREIKAVLDTPEMRQSLDEQGFDPIPSTPEQFAALIRAEYPRWGEVVQKSGAKID